MSDLVGKPEDMFLRTRLISDTVTWRGALDSIVERCKQHSTLWTAVSAHVCQVILVLNLVAYFSIIDRFFSVHYFSQQNTQLDKAYHIYLI